MSNKVEENNWYDYPQKIKYWEPDIDYVMFIDENGNSNAINNISKKIVNSEPISDDEKYFTITGCIFEKKHYSKMRNNVRKLKEKYWNDGYYFDTKHNETRYVCLHSREIRMHTGAFNDSLIDYSAFMEDLSNTLKKIKCNIISVSIDLEKYVRKIKEKPVYEAAFDLLLERYVYSTNKHKKGIIMLESRGKEDDKELLKHINEIINIKGTKGIKSKELKDKIDGVYFNPKWYGGYSSTYSGLEIADLFSYPIHQYIKYNKKGSAFEVIEPKINCYPDYKNKGIKIYP